VHGMSLLAVSEGGRRTPRGRSRSGFMGVREEL
jgi:hypothetical protein